jgi:site-specific DNA recombinase
VLDGDLGLTRYGHLPSPLSGGRLLGYDLDPDHKGSLIPNPEELALVNFAFDTHLASGSIAETAKAMNRRGYRTKAYSSRRGRHHPGTEFGTTSVQHLLKNPAYIGKKEVNKKAKGRTAVSEGKGYRLTNAVWPGIVPQEKFERVQRLLAANGQSNHNGSRPICHNHVLSGGLLFCGRCGSAMEGRSGTGRLGARYYYYVCRRPDCRLRVVADEIEGAILGRIQELTSSGPILERLAEETNRRMARERPALATRRRSLQKELDRNKGHADKVLAEWTALEEHAGRAFLTDKLGELAQRRSDLEQGIAEVDEALKRVELDQVTAETVRSALREFSGLYACLTPFEQKELMRLVLHRAEISERQIVLELHAVPAPRLAVAQSLQRSGPPSWLPDQSARGREPGT